MYKWIMSHTVVVVCTCIVSDQLLPTVVCEFGRFNTIFQDNLLIIRCLCVLMIISVKILGQMIIPFEKWVMILTRFAIMKSQQSTTTEALTVLYMKWHHGFVHSRFVLKRERVVNCSFISIIGSHTGRAISARIGGNYYPLLTGGCALLRDAKGKLISHEE